MTNGNTNLKRILCEISWSITRQRNSYLSSWFWKVKQRRGSKKAIVALARKLLVIIYNMLKHDVDYDEEHFEQVRAKQQSIRIKRIVAEARKLGLEVVPPQNT